jgi:2-hydroxy-3-oxopropionate reductase
MGAAMAANLRRAGFMLTVQTRSRSKAEPLEHDGAIWAGTAAEAARGAACVCLCLPDTADVEAVLFGACGVAEGVERGAVVIDFSTIAPTATALFSARLKAERGVDLLDSPASGGPAGARHGTLTCMVGGDPDAFAAAARVFAAIGRTVTYLGRSSAGQVCQSANQLLVSVTLLAVSEALALGRKAGLNPAAMRTALLGGSARSFVLENHASRIIARQDQPGFRSELMRKDMRLAVAATRDRQVFAPATALATQMMEALVNSGRAGRDASTLGALVAELSGLAAVPR